MHPCLIASSIVFLSTVALCQVQDLPPELEQFIESQENVVQRIADYAVVLHGERIQHVRSCQCSKHSCSSDFLDAPCVRNLGTPGICKVEGRRIDNATSDFRTPPGANPDELTTSLKESICVYSNMDEVFQVYGPEGYGWTYLGTLDGHFRKFPANARLRGEKNGDSALRGCASYDPRVRPWYIAASTGPKDIVLVVDNSGSMNDIAGISGESKWQLTERAVKDILGTLTFTDFVNVVTFSDEAAPLWKASELARGRSENLEKLKNLVSKASPEGGTNFRAAFETAFRLLTKGCQGEGTCSNCHKVILFLTDGRDTSVNGESVRPSKMAAVIQKLQKTLEAEAGSRASIFTYSMSDQADDAIPRQIACANNGSWSFIGPSTNTLDALNSYYLYFAAGGRATPIWVDPYIDSDGLGELTTVAVPFFAKGTANVPDVFLGVAGHDVGFHELQIKGVTHEQALNAIIDRSGRCTPFDITPCELQAYRTARDKRAECPDVFPEERDGEVCFVHGGKAYRRFQEPASWDDAVARCEVGDGQLISLTGESEIKFVAGLASVDGVWVAARKGAGPFFSWLDSAIPDVEESSDYWGVQEPALNQPCVAMDNRGVTGNLFTKPCGEKLQFICRYSDVETCGKPVQKAPRRGYFEIPPVESCQLVEILSITEPIPDAARLQSREVMCDLGEARDNEAVICCGGGEDSSVVEEAWFWVVICAGVVLVALGAGLLVWRRRLCVLYKARAFR